MQFLLLALESSVRRIWTNGYAMHWSLVYLHAYFSDRSNIPNRSWWSCWLYVIFWCYLKTSCGELCEGCVGVKCNTQPSNSRKLLSPPHNRAFACRSRVILLYSHTWSAVHEINLLSTVACTHISIIACMGLQPQIQVKCNVIYERRWKLLTRGGVRCHVIAWDFSCVMMVVIFILMFIRLRSTEQGLDSETSNYLIHILRWKKKWRINFCEFSCPWSKSYLLCLQMERSPIKFSSRMFESE